MASIKTCNRLMVYSLLTISVFAYSGCAEEENSLYTMNTLVKADEFEVAGAPDNSIWTFDIGTGQNGWGNNELQYYTDRPENVKVENGNLKITVIKEPYQGSSYTSARLLTKGLFEQAYGRFEARIKLPWGQGIWPAFWLLGENIDEVSWPQCGEIDIMEYRGQEPTVVHGSVHGPGYSAGSAITDSYTLQNDRFDTDFHIFGIEWGPDYIKYYVDNILYNTITPSDVTGEWVFDHPFFIIINVAVGGSFVGPPGNNTTFPQTMLIDYVRIYE